MEKGFWAIPKSVAKRKDLSLKAKLVSGILWTRKNSDFQAFPSRNYIAEALGVYVDGNQTDYTYSSTDNSWIINIVYEHSIHEVQIIIPEFPSAIATLLSVLIASMAIVLLKRKKRTQ